MAAGWGGVAGDSGADPIGFGGMGIGGCCGMAAGCDEGFGGIGGALTIGFSAEALAEVFFT